LSETLRGNSKLLTFPDDIAIISTTDYTWKQKDILESAEGSSREWYSGVGWPEVKTTKRDNQKINHIVQ